MIVREYEKDEVTVHKVPLYLMGVSAGAAFALKLPMQLGRPVAGVISGGAGGGGESEGE